MDIEDDRIRKAFLPKINEGLPSLKLQELNHQLSNEVCDKSLNKIKQTFKSNTVKIDQSKNGLCKTSQLIQEVDKKEHLNTISTHLDKSKETCSEESKFLGQHALFNSSLKIQKTQMNDLEEMENIHNHQQTTKTLESKTLVLCEEDSQTNLGCTENSQSLAKTSENPKSTFSMKAIEKIRLDKFPKNFKYPTPTETLVDKCFSVIPNCPVNNKKKVQISKANPEINSENQNKKTEAEKLHDESLLYYAKDPNENKLRLMFDFSKIKYLINEDFPFDKLIDGKSIDWSKVKPLWKKFSMEDLIKEDETKNNKYKLKNKNKCEKKIKLEVKKFDDKSFSSNNYVLNNNVKILKNEVHCDLDRFDSTNISKNKITKKVTDEELNKFFDQKIMFKEDPLNCNELSLKRKADILENGVNKVQKVSPSNPLHHNNLKSYDQYSDDSSDEGGIQLEDLSDDEFKTK